MSTEDRYYATVVGWAGFGVLLATALADAVVYWRGWYKDDGALGGTLGGNIAAIIIISFLIGNWRALKNKHRHYCATCGRNAF